MRSLADAAKVRRFMKALGDSPDLEGLPGAELIERGLEDAAARRESVEALLVAVGAPRLRRLGLPVPPAQALPPDAEIRLYRQLGSSTVRDPYSAYNALIRQLVSFAQALEQRQGRHRRLAESERPARAPGR